MLSKKTIKINPELFKLTQTKKLKKPKKVKPTLNVKPNQVKKELLNKIKEYQKNTEKKNQILNQKNNTDIKNNNANNDNHNEYDNFNNEFNNSLNFLQELSKKQLEKKNLRKTLKQERLKNRINNNINIELPNELQNINNDIQVSTQSFSNINNSISTNPIPTNPIPTNPIPTNPIPTNPIPTNPIPTNPIPTNPIPTNPIPTNPIPTNPIPTNPIPTNPIATSSIVTNPIPNDQICSDKNIFNQNFKTNSIEKPYGCLKNGDKPTFREWKRHTLKKTNTIPSIDIEFDSNSNNNFIERQKKLAEAKKQHNLFNPKKLNIVEKKTKTTKYKLGKKDSHVSILIKNTDTRKKIREDYAQLKKMNILEIKNYLRKRNLIKVGTDAPNNILRHLYEQSILSGEINNLNKDNLMHNFFIK